MPPSSSEAQMFAADDFAMPTVRAISLSGSGTPSACSSAPRIRRARVTAGAGSRGESVMRSIELDRVDDVAQRRAVEETPRVVEEQPHDPRVLPRRPGWRLAAHADGRGR